MPKASLALTEDLLEFCKITKKVKNDIVDLLGSADPEALLQQSWKDSFVGKKHQVLSGGNVIVFDIYFTRSDGEDIWVVVTLKKSTKDSEPLPYWTCAAEKRDGSPREAKSLEDFAFFHYDLYDELARIALAEPWSFAGEGLDLLKFYLNGTFLRLIDEHKLGYATDAEGDMCVWCTGLVNAHYEDIYCFCTPNTHANAKQKWVVRGFCTSGSSHFGQRMRRAFGSEPPLRANYFQSIADTIFDGNLDLSIDYQHIYKRVYRIGISALQVLMASSTKAMDIVCQASNAKPSEREEILKNLCVLVAEDVVLQQSLHNALALAADRARARARYMYTSALPLWNPRNGGSIAFCLPLCLVVEERVDTVLIASLTADVKEPFYEGKTIFDVRMAYRNARIIQRTDGMTGWVSSAFTDKENDDAELLTSAFAASSVRTATSPSSLVSNGNMTLVDTEEHAVTSVVKLVPVTNDYPELLIERGDTIGLVRRQNDELPRIQLPVEEGFIAVSQRHGRFESDGESWTYVHEGLNWSRIKKKDGSSVILTEKGSSASLDYGDTLSFAGSPEYKLEQC